MVQCDADLRPGGAYRYVLGRGEAERFAFFGEYREIVRATRLVYTQSFEPIPGVAVITMSFEEKDGATTVVSRELYPSKEALDGALKSGMEEGMLETYDLLERLVISLAG